MDPLVAFVLFVLLSLGVGIAVMLITNSPESKGYQLALGFWSVGPFFGAIMAPTLYGITPLNLAVFLLSYYLPGFGITIGYHRLFTHNSFKAVEPVRWVLALLGTMAVQGELNKWVALHRKHHQYTDIPEKDPHTPYAYGRGFFNIIRGLYHAHLGWMFEGEPPDYDKYLKKTDPVMNWFSRYWLPIVIIRFALPFVIVYPFAGYDTAMGAFLWSVAGAWLTLHATFAVNSICHIWGTRPFRGKSVGESTNNIFIGILAHGEGYHNGHHAFPTSAHHGMTRLEKAFDMSYLIICLLEKLGFISEVRRYTPSQISALRKLYAVTDQMEQSA
jgi:stearoyl-CoA desaturase (delta-9 desaturase)